MRGKTDVLLAALVRPSTVGAAYVALLLLGAEASAVQGHEGLGEHGEAIRAFVVLRFGGEMTRIGLALLGAALLVGAALGVVAGALVRLRDAAAGKPPRRPLALAATSLVVVAGLHLACLLVGMARWPQLYAASFYARGGVLRAVQVVTTDLLGPWGVGLVTTGVVLLYGLGPVAWAAARGRGLRAAGARTGAGISGGLGLLALAGGLRASRPPELAAAAAPVASATARAPAARPTRAPLNVLVLAADSLRADRLTPRTTPALAALASRGTTFERAYVSLPRTFSSWVTILTGRPPHAHGIRSMFPRWEDRAKDFDALPARFRAAGYGTEVVSDYAGDIFSRIDLGFDTVDTPSFDFRQLVRQRAIESATPLLPFLQSRLGRRAFPVLREMNDAADPGLLANDASAAVRRLAATKRPFFLTVFFSTAHFPYAAPAPYYGLFTDPAYRGRFKYHRPVGLDADAAVDAADVAQVRGLYDGAVRAVDDGMARVLRTLGDEGLAGETIVVVTADHGETLYEGGHPPGHGDHLFGDEGTHVPLLVVDPRTPSAHRVEAIVRDVDIAPTLYDLTGVRPPEGLAGRSLARTALAPAFAFAETELWFTEDVPGLAPALRLPYPGIEGLTELDARHGDDLVLREDVRSVTTMARHRMVRDARWKLVYVPTREGAKYMLFDTAADPLEVRDVAAEQPAEVVRLRRELWAYMLQDRAMIERGGLLVPRDEGAKATPDGVRLGEGAETR